MYLAHKYLDLSSLQHCPFKGGPLAIAVVDGGVVFVIVLAFEVVGTGLPALVEIVTGLTGEEPAIGTGQPDVKSNKFHPNRVSPSLMPMLVSI